MDIMSNALNFAERTKELLFENICTEDNEIYIKNGFKYGVFNLVREFYPEDIEDFEKENDIIKEEN